MAYAKETTPWHSTPMHAPVTGGRDVHGLSTGALPLIERAGGQAVDIALCGR